jgi:RNA 3'-terminal phosphate cyclase (ATP)/RNA 3'-terminal phosphate cyclase (GTP)
MIKIDGSIGGGQILRTSVALSALLNKPVHLVNVRQKRPKPGLKAQHISSIQGVAKLCDAEVTGLELGSKEVTFVPHRIKSKKINIRIPTAGSIGLVLQALLPAAIFSGETISVHISGGATSGKWSPPVLYMRDVLMKILERFGAKVTIEIAKHGFYPKGGADVFVKVSPSRMKRISLIEPGQLKSIYGTCIASEHLQKAKVVERVKRSAMKQLPADVDVKFRTDYVSTYSAGVFVLLCAEYENTVIGADVIGERGVRSEIVGQKVAELLKSRMGNVLDPHAADNLIPFLCLAGGEIRIPKETEHIKTNIQTCRCFGIGLHHEGDRIWAK